MPTRKLNVFLCHAKEDKSTVRELYRQLTAEGWMDVCLDEQNLLPGQEWDMEIEKAVEAADVVIVCLSSHSVDKEGYVQKELRFVLNIAEEKPEGTIFVVPLRLGDCQVPRRIRGWQYADYFPNEERARAYQRLLFSLRMRARKLDISTLSLAEEQARRDAEERARLEAEEKARKEKDEKDKKAAEEKARLQAERRAKREREAREKKEAEAVGQIANTSPAAGVGLSPMPEKPPESSVGVGRDSKDSNIVTGDNNVIVQIAPPVAEKEEPPRSASVPVRAPATLKEKKATPDIRPWFFLGGLLILVVLCGFGITYLIQYWPATPSLTQISEVSETSEAFPTLTAIPFTKSPTEAPTLVATPELGVGSTWNSPKDGMVMMFVPAGTFSMGSDSGSDDEKPVHDVTLDSYWMDKTEVTNAMYAKCVETGQCDAPSSNKSYTRDSYYGNSQYADYPVLYVTLLQKGLRTAKRAKSAKKEQSHVFFSR